MAIVCPYVFCTGEDTTSGNETLNNRHYMMEEKLTTSKFLIGERATIADIFILPEIDQLTP